MGTFKKCKIVILPTNEKALFSMSLINILLLGGSHPENNRYKNHHLYITSDDEIKKGDWCYHTGRKIVIQFLKQSGYFREYDALKKIIATTDSSLTYHDKTPIGENVNGLYKQLPQMPKQFIEHFVSEYNKGNIITDVLVEYENYYVGAVYDDEGFYD